MSAAMIQATRRRVAQACERLRSLMSGLGFMLGMNLSMALLWTSMGLIWALPHEGLAVALRAAAMAGAATCWGLLPMQPVAVAFLNIAPPRGWRLWTCYLAAYLVVGLWCRASEPGGALTLTWEGFHPSLSDLAGTLEASVTGALTIWAFHYHRTAAQGSAQLVRSQLEAAQRESEMQRVRLQLLRAQIEPHFLFNTLANIRSLARADRAAAVQLIDRFLRYLEAALPQLRTDESSLRDEMQLVGAYLAIYQVRMGTRLGYEIRLPAELRELRIPTMLLLTLVENALKHGVNVAVDGGRIHVSAAREREELVLKVADSGRGLAGPQGQGEGLANARMRLLLRYGTGATLSLAAAEPRGVVATVRIPQREAA